MFSTDEHPRPETTLATLQKLRPVVRPDGTVTAGNASGINDGAAAMFIASEEAAKRHGLTPRARILGMAVAGVEPDVMGVGPVPACRKLLARLGLSIADFDLIEINEAFAVAGDRLDARARRRSRQPRISTRMAARSRSAIRSACPAHVWR